MRIVKKYFSIGLSGVLLLVLFACTAEIGSEQWCTEMQEKSKADWTANETVDFAKHCVLK